MEKWSIGNFKRSTKAVLKKDYWRMIAVCFIMAVVCGMYSNTTALIDDYPDIARTFSGGTADDEQTDENQALDPYASQSNAELLKEISDNYSKTFGNSGFFSGSSVASFISSGITMFFPNPTIGNMMLRGLAMAGKAYAGITIAIFIIFMVLGVLLDIFLFNMLRIGEKRFFMETRTYHDTKIYRLFYPYQIGRIGNSALTMLLRNIFQILWMLTIIGGPIKYYEYSMIPYILAENPDIDWKTCFRMSKEMMRGHKWHAFLMDLSFIGWWILGFLTFGLVQLFFLNPYQTGSWTELYFELRGRYIRNAGPGAEKLCDLYLTERPSFVPQSAQAGFIGGMKSVASEIKVGAENAASLLATGAKKVGSGVVADLTEAFNADGATLTRDQANAMRAQIRVFGNEDVYPMAISPVQPTEKAKKVLLMPIRADRKYTVSSYILMFFLFSFVGWVWEVSYCMAQTGEFANRGVLTGPWLPIYGTGGVIMVLFLRKWLKKPVLTFALIVTVSLTVEYFTALVLWVMWHKKYWDYSTEFLNLQGRICLKGGIAFGVGGMLFIYLLAPRIDDWLIQRIPKKAQVIVCVILLAVFGADALHSAYHPNDGKGVTSLLETSPDEILENTGRALKSRLHRL